MALDVYHQKDKLTTFGNSNRFPSIPSEGKINQNPLHIRRTLWRDKNRVLTKAITTRIKALGQAIDIEIPNPRSALNPKNDALASALSDLYQTSDTDLENAAKRSQDDLMAKFEIEKARERLKAHQRNPYNFTPEPDNPNYQTAQIALYNTNEEVAFLLGSGVNQAVFMGPSNNPKLKAIIEKIRALETKTHIGFRTKILAEISIWQATFRPSSFEV